MDQKTDLEGGLRGGSVEQEAISMVDGVVDQAVNLVVQRFPKAADKADEARQRIKEAVFKELNRLASQGQGM
jgi:hypothetical protein